MIHLLLKERLLLNGYHILPLISRHEVLQLPSALLALDDGPVLLVDAVDALVGGVELQLVGVHGVKIYISVSNGSLCFLSRGLALFRFT